MIMYLTHKTDIIKKALKDWTQYAFTASADKATVNICFVDKEGQRYEVTLKALYEGGYDEN